MVRSDINHLTYRDQLPSSKYIRLSHDDGEGYDELQVDSQYTCLDCHEEDIQLPVIEDLEGQVVTDTVEFFTKLLRPLAQAKLLAPNLQTYTTASVFTKMDGTAYEPYKSKAAIQALQQVAASTPRLDADLKTILNLGPRKTYNHLGMSAQDTNIQVRIIRDEIDEAFEDFVSLHCGHLQVEAAAKLRSQWKREFNQIAAVQDAYDQIDWLKLPDREPINQDLLAHCLWTEDVDDLAAEAFSLCMDFHSRDDFRRLCYSREQAAHWVQQAYLKLRSRYQQEDSEVEEDIVARHAEKILDLEPSIPVHRMSPEEILVTKDELQSLMQTYWWNPQAVRYLMDMIESMDLSIDEPDKSIKAVFKQRKVAT